MPHEFSESRLPPSNYGAPAADGHDRPGRERRCGTAGSGVAFFSLGCAMLAGPRLAPEWFQTIAPDGASTRALWVQCMAWVNCLTGAFTLVTSWRRYFARDHLATG